MSSSEESEETAEESGNLKSFPGNRKLHCSHGILSGFCSFDLFCERGTIGSSEKNLRHFAKPNERFCFRPVIGSLKRISSIADLFRDPLRYLMQLGATCESSGGWLWILRARLQTEAQTETGDLLAVVGTAAEDLPAVRSRASPRSIFRMPAFFDEFRKSERFRFVGFHHVNVPIAPCQRARRGAE